MASLCEDASSALALQSLFRDILEASNDCGRIRTYVELINSQFPEPLGYTVKIPISENSQKFSNLAFASVIGEQRTTYFRKVANKRLVSLVCARN